MTVATGVPVVWLAPDASGESPSREPPNARAGAALEAWARARGFHLTVADEAHALPLPIDPTVADRVEEDLTRARDAIVTADPKGAERALAHAEGELLAHPELPQAAWLLAEVERGWSMRWRRLPPADIERAAAAWRRAEGLDDGRTAGIGEDASSSKELPVTLPLAVEGDTGLRAWLDGRPVSPGPVTRAPGRHQLVVTREGVAVWASWVTFAPEASVRARLGPFPPCTFADLASATRTAGDPAEASVRADAVRCPQWVAASPADSTTAIRVALCEGAHCGPLLEWRPAANTPTPPPPRVHPAEKGGWPAWATWTLVGAGAVAITGAVLAASGAFDASHPEPRFVSGGVKTQGAFAPFTF